MKRAPIPTEELITWMEDDWLGLWELTAIGGTDEGVPLVEVIEFVIQSVEPGLRNGTRQLWSRGPRPVPSSIGSRRSADGIRWAT